MRLKKLVLHGFKSFADRTEFSFDAPITGIVGPNGCGKSNVVDAFKWVLGEQSAKSLRGDAMLDVIFNGASTRKPSNCAEVVLVFENPRREDGTRLLALDFDEVSVGRRLYRDGTSEYTVNNKGSRLKDIRELFLDTGVGVDAYSVIEQGRVAQLLDANPQERRLIFEEAAGISKFKARKKESQRKLEKVDQNLLRVTDIVDEVDRRLRGVRVQAGRARVYQEHATRLAELRLEFALREYHTHGGELKAVETRIADERFKLDDARADLDYTTGQLTEKRDAEQAAVSARQRAEYELVELSGQIEQARQAEQFAARQIAQATEQLAAMEEEDAAGKARLEEAKAQLAAERERLAGHTREVEERQAEISRLAEAFKQGQLRLNQLHQEQERHKAGVLDAMRKHAQTSSRLGGIEIERKNITAQQHRQAERRRTLVADLEVNESKKTELDEKLKAAVEEIAQRQKDADAAKVEAQQLGKQMAELTEELSGAKQHRSSLLGRQKVLTDLEQRQQGVSEGVKTVLRRREKDFPFVRGLVADVLRVDIEHARVVEAALDGRDQWLVVDSVAEAVSKGADFAKLEGRVNFVSAEPWPASAFDAKCHAEANPDAPTATVAPDSAFYIRHPTSDINHYAEELAASPVPVRLALDLVRVEPRFGPVARRLLSRIAIVDDLAAAEQLRVAGPHGWRYVTKAGEVLDTDGTLHAGPPTAAMGLLSRRSELEQLAAQVQEIERRIGTLTNELAGANQQARELEQKQSDLRQAVYQANTKRVELSSSMSQVTDRINLLKREQPLLDRELETLLEQQGRLTTEEATLSQRKAEIEAAQAASQKAAEEAQAAHAALADELKGDGEKLSHARIAIAEFQQKLIASRNHEQRLAGQVGEATQQIARVAGQLEQLAGRKTQVERELATARHRQESLIEQQSQLKARLEGLTAKVSELTAEVKDAAGALDAARAMFAEVETLLNKLAVRESELRVRVETVVARAKEELGIDLPAKYEEVCAAPPIIAPTASSTSVEPALDADGNPIAAAVDADGNAIVTAATEVVAGSTGESETADGEGSDAVVATEAKAPAVGYSPAEKDWDAVAREIAELREKIQRLGNVNLDAIGEQDELEKRSEFLAKELTDLRDAKLQLEKLIEEINAESSVRFQKTFELVREHFQALFRKLFGGGKADLFLETELAPKQSTITVTHPDGTTTTEPAPMVKVDPLDAGIEVIARPPGKQPVTISQLSGGEKTMTCIALLMSIFKSKPSPFCILDEVDAALDEANNGRFNMIVQEFLDRSQFIVITHSKRTMTIAEQLYGITQQEQGVSRRVSVKFDQVGRDGKIDAAAVKEQESRDKTSASTSAAATPEPLASVA